MILILFHGDIKFKIKKTFFIIKTIINKKFFLKKIFISYIIKKNFILNFLTKNYKKLIIIPIFINKGGHLKFDLNLIIKNIFKIFNFKCILIKIFFKNKKNLKFLSKRIFKILNKNYLYFLY